MVGNPNVLSARYVGKEINYLFSDKGRILAERELWIAVMRAQKEMGVSISRSAIEKYERAKGNIDLERIREIELKRRHDVKAKIEAFNEAAGVEENEQHIHKGLTSRDLDDNVWQVLIMKASKVIFGKMISILRHLVDKSEEYSKIAISARTHMQPAQLTLLGRRFSMWAEELYVHLKDFENFLENYPLRGIKGPVGTQFDVLTLIGDKNKVVEFEKNVVRELGFTKVFDSPGQIYPRSLDGSLVSKLAGLGSALQNFSNAMRVMARDGLVTEGFKEGQVGSSAMPHKMNTRSSERIWAFAELLKMYADGVSRISGAQWEEGDVSDSALRRVVIPDAFYVADGLCETTLTVLNEMGAYEKVISRELDRHLPFLATTEILMLAVKSGIGRERAHEIIKKYAMECALDMRLGRNPEMAAKLARDPLFSSVGISEEQINSLLREREHLVGNAKDQIASVARMCRHLVDSYPLEAKYEPGEIL